MTIEIEKVIKLIEKFIEDVPKENEPILVKEGNLYELMYQSEITGYNKAINDVKATIHNIYTQNLYCAEDMCDGLHVNCSDCFYECIKKNLEQLKAGASNAEADD